MGKSGTLAQSNDLDIALIGMSGRFPGAENVDKFWQNLRDGTESISFFTEQEGKFLGIDNARLSRSNYVKAGALLKDIELFDSSFFGFSPREAEVMDPQHRLFLECAWEAIESAGYDPEAYNGLIGVYAGAGLNSYLLFNILPNYGPTELVDNLHILSVNDKDFLSTGISYKLNLKGPSVTVQTFCSTSLVAVHLACQSLLNGECDMALAGGVTVKVPHKVGYLYHQEGILSPDGHCRTFDDRAQGTIFGSGVGIVVLKRLSDALADGDCIHAAIKGSTINNDGALKVSFTAPSVDGQTEAIVEALANAGLDAEAISYVEAHGTGTALGDPIEVAALTKAFRSSTDKQGFCAIGSVKTNIGHLDTVAGVAGLIKTVLSLKHKQIPPSLHFERPNPQIDFANSPFYVNTKLSEWKTNGTPRRAGISSFGFGGTNAHVILEEAPLVKASSPSRPWQLLMLSAKTGSAVETATANLATHLKQYSNLNLADVAYTLQVGRRAFSHRRMVVCRDVDDAVEVLLPLEPQRVLTVYQENRDLPVVFMFPGQGAQYVNMGLELYQVEPIFREQVDRCCELLEPYLELDLRHVLFPGKEQTEAIAQQLQQTSITQLALFVIEYALAKLWMAWGVQPVAMIGHSIGEYVAACLAGVFSLEDALALVSTRGRLMQQIPAGAMLSVPLSEEEVKPFLDENLSLGASNAPSLSVISGSIAAVDDLQNRLNDQGVDSRRLHTSHAFHSSMMEPILEPFTEQVEKVKLNPPQIPFISNVTGTWITAAEATTPSYWSRHLRQTVRFAAGITELMKDRNRVLLEVGPGRTLSIFARQHQVDESLVLTSMRHPQSRQSDVEFLLNTLGQLWLAGVQIDWSGFYAQEQRHRIPLPTYPFERQRHWIEPPAGASEASNRQISLSKKPNIADWFYTPSWKRSALPRPFKAGSLATQKLCWLVFVDACGMGSQIVKRLEQENQDVISVTVGEQFAKLNDCAYKINPQRRDDYDALIQALRALDKTPRLVAHLWGVTPNHTLQDNTLREPTQLKRVEYFEQCQALGFYSLLFLVQVLAKQNVTAPVQINVVTNHLYDVVGEEELSPEKATVLGPCKVIPQEYLNITCRSIDIAIANPEDQLIDSLMAELAAQPYDLVVAYRSRHRWVQTFEPFQVDDAVEETTRLREGGVYLIAGDLVGSLGLVFAEYLAQTVHAKLALIGNSDLPEKPEWGRWIATHEPQDKTCYQIRKMQELEALGAEFLMIKADVANEEQMQVAINQVREHFGQIHGVLHVAQMGNAQTAFPIEEIGKSECEWHFQSKVYGLLVLEKVLQNSELDFYILQSSLSSVVGGLGLVAYSAANLFLDTMANQCHRTSLVPRISVNWDACQFEDETEKSTAFGTSLAEWAMTPQEVGPVLQRILSMGSTGQVVVSTNDLRARFDQWLKLKSFQDKRCSKQGLHYSESNLQNVGVAPRNEVEQTVTNIWQEILGVKWVGIHDNFFKLGGHSLLAVQVISRLREVFQVDLPLRSILFESPTVAGLATSVVEKLPSPEVLEEMAQLLEKIEILSPDDVQKELAKES